MKAQLTDTEDRITLKNGKAAVSVELSGGAFTDFHLTDQLINPLTFKFSRKQMPPNNRSGAPYRGHFLCLGRWGPVSKGEMAAGVPNHGQASNIDWQIKKPGSRFSADMQADCDLEGLSVRRKVVLDKTEPVFGVEEKVKNVHPLGRLYNMVQHPTIAHPFLDDSTTVNCNGTYGFDQFKLSATIKKPFVWPGAKDEKGHALDLANPSREYSSVFSFVVNKKSRFGWLTAYNPGLRLLFGYIWPRADYPWIHLWYHWENKRIKYRGLEFGTAGIHQPFGEIINTATELLGERTVQYIDAGQTINKHYLSFLYQVGTNERNSFRDLEIDPQTKTIILKFGSNNYKLITDLIDLL